MKNLLFFLWLLLFPLVDTIVSWIRSQYEISSKSEKEWIGVFFTIIVYFYVGYLLYEK